MTAPDYNTHPHGELPLPQGLVLAVFTPYPTGSRDVTWFGPLRPDATPDDEQTLHARAREHARQTGGTVVRLAALADYSGGVTA